MSAREDHRHLPIEDQHRALMNDLAHELADLFKGYGFALLIFPFGEQDGRMNYISNAPRKDMVAAMEEFTAKNRLAMSTPQGQPQ